MFLANENFPRPGTIILRKNGIIVKSIQEDFPGISDEDVIDIALESTLTILTFDSDYGELIFNIPRKILRRLCFLERKELCLALLLHLF